MFSTVIKNPHSLFRLWNLVKFKNLSLSILIHKMDLIIMNRMGLFWEFNTSKYVFVSLVSIQQMLTNLLISALLYGPQKTL